MDVTREYWAFVSYRHLDNHEAGREWATWIAREIETYEVPPELVGTTGERGDEIPERIYPVFRDEDELSAEDDLASPIYEALRNSKTLVVVCSPRAVSSRYVGNEITYFKSLGRGDRVLAMMIEGEPHDDGERECFPEALKHPVNAEGDLDEKIEIEPVAADFRLFDGSQGWTTLAECRRNLRNKVEVERYRERCELAKLKLIAGILGVPLGVLVERDKAYQLAQAKRRARIFTAVSAAMGVLAVLAAVGGVFALLNAKAAERERDRAQQSEQVALQARGTVEELISDMLFDLGGKLEPIGRLDLLEDVSLSAENYFDNLPPDQVDSESERNRGVMLDSRARVLRAVGDLDGALEHYREALEVSRRLLEEDPENDVHATDIIISLKNVADILVAQNRTDEAVPLYEEAARNLGELAESHLGAGGSQEVLLSLLGEYGEEKREWAVELLSSNPGLLGLMSTSATLMERLGKIAQTRGDFDTARVHLEGAVELLQAIVGYEPESRPNRESLVAGYNALGNLAIATGDSEEAGRQFQQVIDLSREQLIQEPFDVPWQETLAAGLERLSLAASLEGDEERYRRLTNEALEIWKSIAEADPTNTERQRTLYVGIKQSASADKAAGDLESSAAKLAEAGKIMEALVELDPSNVLWRQDLAFTLAARANAKELAGDQEAAREIHLEGLTHQRFVTEGAPENLTYRRNLLLALNGVAISYWAAENHEEATRYFEESAETGQSIVADLPEPTMQSFKDLSDTFAYLGQVAQIVGDIEGAVGWFEDSLRTAKEAFAQGVGWEGLSEEVFEEARRNIDALAETVPEQ